MICKDTYDHDSKVSVVNSGHNFHLSCISSWLEAHIDCPVCRQEVKIIIPMFLSSEPNYNTQLGKMTKKYEDLLKIKQELNEKKSPSLNRIDFTSCKTSNNHPSNSHHTKKRYQFKKLRQTAR